MAHVVTADNFEAEVLKSTVPVLVDFYADWCGPCQALIPTIDELASELEGKAKIVKVDVDASGELAQKYEVMSIPALKVFNGGEVTGEAVGLQSKDNLKKLLGL